MVGSEGDIEGQTVRIPLAQLYAQQERYFILETEVAAGESGSSMDLATVSVTYRNLQSENLDKLASTIQVRFDDSEKIIEDAKDLEAYAYCSLQVTTERNREATALRDAGQIQAASEMLKQNAEMLDLVQATCAEKGVTSVLPELEKVESYNRIQSAAVVDESKWGATRKGMRSLQNMVEQQQVYSVEVPSHSVKSAPTKIQKRK